MNIKSPESGCSESRDSMESPGSLYEIMAKRRSVRRFADKKLPLETIKECIKIAGTAPSGGNSQPWHFAIVMDPSIKAEIRKQAEQEEFKFYHSKENSQILHDLKPLNTNWEKPHLEEASALIVIFAKFSHVSEGAKKNFYYPIESTGIATGILITTLHQLGIATLTHTPKPMGFLSKALMRPRSERPFLILAVGFAHEKYSPPCLLRRNIEDICSVH